MESDLLQLARKIAQKAHAGQVDKGGNPYLCHVQAVADAVEGTQQKIIAYLHDVCEDTAMTLEDLRSLGFSENIVCSVDILTQRENQSYAEYLAGIKPDADARQVKIADLRHNMDLGRIEGPPTEKDRRRMEKYKQALEFLKQ